VEGIALPIGKTHGGQPLQHQGQMTWGRLDLDALRKALPYPIAGIYVQRTTPGTAPEFPSALPAPALDDGPHLSYMLQWFAFATLALVFAGIVWWKRT
jgi:cytochrome oxidase assembly protein ShyY1